MEVSKIDWQGFNMDGPAFDALCSSVVEHGIMNPIVVARTSKGRYRVVDGRMRLAAAVQLGMTEVPAVVVSPGQEIEMKITCSASRVPVSKEEYKKQLKLFIEKSPYRTLNELAHMLGRSESWLRAQLAEDDWTTKEGKGINFKDMEDGYLGNVLRLMVRRGAVVRKASKEAEKRGLLWAVDQEHLCEQVNLIPTEILNTQMIHAFDLSCTFDVDGRPCFNEAVMWTLAREPRCGSHRPDAHAHYQVKCDGCMKVAELVGGMGDMRFCQSCYVDSNGVFYRILLWLLFLLSWRR